MTGHATEPVLRTRGLSVTFGGLRAVDHVDLDLEAGSLIGLIGPNGAGKTTCIDALTGFVPSEGSIHFEGSDISRWPAHRRARAGLVRTWQSVELFADLSVAENLLIGHDTTGGGMLSRQRPTMDIEAVLRRLDLVNVADRSPSELSHGQQKLVGVARALATEPSFILMDEPAAGLDTTESAELGRHLRRIVEDGTGLLLIDHDMSLVLTVCDEIYVFDRGTVIAKGTPEMIRHDPEVLRAYLGLE